MFTKKHLGIVFFSLALMAILTGSAFATQHSVSIPGFSFSPATLTIAVGDTVTWTNNHTFTHTSTSDDGYWNSGNLLPGQSYSHAFSYSGSYPYHCAIHPSMLGTINVTPISHSVSIVDFAFSPQNLTVGVGDTVVWTNNGNVGHSVTSDYAHFNSGILNPGQSYSRVFTSDIHPYHCTPHPFMTGIITVTGGAPSDCNVGMVTDNNPVVVPPGGSFGLTGTIANNTNAPISTDVWIRLYVPNYGMFGPLYNFQNIPLSANQSISAHLNQPIPGFAPLGVYSYYAYCGEVTTGAIHDLASFNFTVAAGRGDGNASDWVTEGGFESVVADVPSEFSQNGNYPNPFNAQTNITFDVPTSGNVSLTIFNLAGQKVATLVDGNMEAGRHTVTWDASTAASGIYFYRMVSGDKTFTNKMSLLK